MKKRSQTFEGPKSDLHKRYQQDLEYYASRKFESTHINHLFQSVQNSQVVYLGDFHTFDQSLKNLVRITQQLLKNKSKFILALEMIQTDYQSILDAFLMGQLTELEFLDSIRYSESWRFPWTHYKILFDLATEHGIQIKALNSTGSLEQRDQQAAEIIVQTVQKYPSTPVLVLFGELHIAPNRLPKQVLLQGGQTIDNQTIIHQNLDAPYWSIVDQGLRLNDHKVIKYSDQEFCLLSSPPWMKYESMIYWFENLMDDPDYDLHEYILETGLKIFNDNTYDNFVNLLVNISANFGLHKDTIPIDSIKIYDHSNLDFVSNQIETINPKGQKELYQNLLDKNQSFFCYEDGFIYCANYSVNKLSTLAGMFLFVFFNQRLLKEVTKASLPNWKRLLFYIYLNANGYLASKTINPFLKCDLYKDIELHYRKSDKKSDQALFHSILSILDDPIEICSKCRGLSRKKIFVMGQIIGEFLGENQYLKMQKYSNIQFDLLHLTPIKTFDLDLDSFVSLFQNLLPNSIYKMQKKRMF
jgi:hypothetical protein